MTFLFRLEFLEIFDGINVAEDDPTIIETYIDLFIIWNDSRNFIFEVDFFLKG